MLGNCEVIELTPGDTVRFVQQPDHYIDTRYWFVTGTQEYLRCSDGHIQDNSLLVFMGWSTFDIYRYNTPPFNKPNSIWCQNITGAKFLLNGRLCWSRAFVPGNSNTKNLRIVK